MKIDTKKLVAEIKEINNFRKGKQSSFVCPVYPDRTKLSPSEYTIANANYWKEYRKFTERTSTLRATILYSIRAHMRGHLHMTKRYIPNPDGSGKLMLIPFTMDTQAELIRATLPEFLLEETVQAA